MIQQRKRGRSLFDTVELRWPVGWKRETERHKAPYRVQLTAAIRDLRHELELMKATEVLVSGGPISDRVGAEVGVAVYWRDAGGELRAIACDHWDSQRANARAIGLTKHRSATRSRWRRLTASQLGSCVHARMVTRRPRGAVGLDAWQQMTSSY